MKKEFLTVRLREKRDKDIIMALEVYERTNGDYISNFVRKAIRFYVSYLTQKVGTASKNGM